MQTSAEETCDKQSDSWSELKTVSSFDSGDAAGTTCTVGELQDGNMLVQNFKPLSGVSLLVECLIEQLCKLLERDPLLQKKLYHVICNKLHSMKLLDETYGVEEFEFMRSHYQRALYHLLSVSTTVTDTSTCLLHVPSPLFELVSLAGQNHLSWSRYHTDYQQLAFINKGGFGKVYKARNKLDGEEYAVKKIWLRYQSVKSFLQKLKEVKMLAQLNHPNIVSYKAAWLEPLDYSRLTESALQAEVPRFSCSKNSSHEDFKPALSVDDSGGIEFKDSNSTSRKSENTNVSSGDGSSPTRKDSVHSKNTNISSSSDSTSAREDSVHSVNEGAEVFSSQELSLVCKRNVWKHTEVISVSHEACAVLYIQMQLCHNTLGQWLAARNVSGENCLDTRQIIKIFHQIVSGVQYIHAKGIVHHDIKPSNIFVNVDLSQVQVGDFGLACCFQHSSEQVTLLSPDLPTIQKHTREVGTIPYAAPEQLRGKCDPKSDLYSLGIVLFELLQPFATSMERTKLISTLKTEHILPTELGNYSPKLARLIILLINSSVSKRPTATQLLDMLDEASQEIDNAGSKCDKDGVIERLRQVICEKDEEIDRLSARIRSLEQYIKLHSNNGLVSD